MSRLFIAEKPSLARAIAEVLPGPPRRRDNYLECDNGDLVAWCAGHILELAPPDAYNPDYKTWALTHLPITPTTWKLTPTVPDLLKTIKALLPRTTTVVHAGDPDREGQLLVDEVLEFLGYRGPVERVLISDLNPPAVRTAIASIQPNAKFRRLYDAALGRQRADWLYGLNMTRLYTVLGRAGGYSGVLSVGRVQTPLLGLIVRRDIDIERFVPKPYFVVTADVTFPSGPLIATWRPDRQADDALDSEGRLVDLAKARDIERKTNGQVAIVTTADSKRHAEPPPLPYSLDELQVDAGRRLGLSPKQILDVCQSLYETHKLTTYPRSDCSYLPEGHLAEAPHVVRAIADLAELAPVAARADLALRSRAWNDTKITAHHAIIPTPRSPAQASLSSDERRVYELIARRFLAQFFPAHEYNQLDVQLHIAGETFGARGRQPVSPGWQLAIQPAPDDGDQGAGPGETDDRSESRIPPVKVGHEGRTSSRTVEKKTTPPRRFTSASLVAAMTGIARFVSDAKIKQLLREADGIGTPATRAAIIQTLFDRKFIEEKKRQIVSTSTARALIAALPDVATRPDLTALWEAGLRRVHDGEGSLDDFLAAVRAQLGELVTRAKAAGPLQLPGIEQRPCAAPGCSGTLRQRPGKNGAFWACSRYPACTFTQDAEPRPANSSRGTGRRRKYAT
jgi:DNA topoisomerase-3